MSKNVHLNLFRLALKTILEEYVLFLASEEKMGIKVDLEDRDPESALNKKRLGVRKAIKKEAGGIINRLFKVSYEGLK